MKQKYFPFILTVILAFLFSLLSIIVVNKLFFRSKPQKVSGSGSYQRRTPEEIVESVYNGTYFNPNKNTTPTLPSKRPKIFDGKDYVVDIEFEKMILITEVRVDNYIFDNGDVNGDDKKNCIDHAIMFKILWDKYYPDLCDKCFIIRNSNKDMSHLFIGLYDRCNTLFYIEPWMLIGTMKYNIEDCFWEKFDPNFNHYDETELWLREYYEKKPIFGIADYD